MLQRRLRSQVLGPHKRIIKPYEKSKRNHRDYLFRGTYGPFYSPKSPKNSLKAEHRRLTPPKRKKTHLPRNPIFRVQTLAVSFTGGSFSNNKPFTQKFQRVHPLVTLKAEKNVYLFQEPETTWELSHHHAADFKKCSDPFTRKVGSWWEISTLQWWPPTMTSKKVTNWNHLELRPFPLQNSKKTSQQLTFWALMLLRFGHCLPTILYESERPQHPLQWWCSKPKLLTMPELTKVRLTNFRPVTPIPTFPPG